MVDRSVLMFGLHRGGSSIIGRLLQLLLGGAGYQMIDEGKKYFRAGYLLGDIPQEFYQAMRLDAMFYGPFREYPPPMRLVDLSGFTRILVVRDPRDCLVSAYYAWRGVHSADDRLRKLDALPTQREAAIGIDEYCVLNAIELRERLESLCQLCLHYPDTLVFRYEDIFADPSGWLDVVVARLGVRAAGPALDQARIEAVMTPAHEDPKRHHRQGAPGDQHRKLSRQTCLYLTEVLEPQLRFFSYSGVRISPAVPHGIASHDAPAADEIASLKRIIVELQTENGYRIDEVIQLKNAIAKASAARDDAENSTPPPATSMPPADASPRPATNGASRLADCPAPVLGTLGERITQH